MNRWINVAFMLRVCTVPPISKHGGRQAHNIPRHKQLFPHSSPVAPLFSRLAEAAARGDAAVDGAARALAWAHGPCQRGAERFANVGRSSVAAATTSTTSLKVSWQMLDTHAGALKIAADCWLCSSRLALGLVPRTAHGVACYINGDSPADG